MKNYKQEGEVLTLIPDVDVPSGTGHLFGASMFGVAINNTAGGTLGEFLTEGVVTISKVTGLSISVGDRVFWDAAGDFVNKTAALQQCVGIAVEDATSLSTTVTIKLGAVPAIAA